MDGKENIIIVKSNPEFEWERKGAKKRGAKVAKKVLSCLLAAAIAFGGGVGGMFVYDRYIADGTTGDVVIQQVTPNTSQTGKQPEGDNRPDSTQRPDGGNFGNITPDGGADKSGGIGNLVPDTPQSGNTAGNPYIGGDVVIQQVAPQAGTLTSASQVYNTVLPSTVLITCETDVVSSSGSGYGSFGGSGSDPFGNFGSGGSGSLNPGSGSQQPQTSTAISYGSGVIMTADGYIMTNAHVVDGATRVKVTLSGGESYDAVVLGADENTDIAVIKIGATGLTAAVFADSSSAVVGDEAYVVGNPLGIELSFSLTCGNISALEREIEIEDTLMRLIQIDAAVNPGNSGGPMANSQGQIIGIINAKIVDEDVEGVGFAIPVNKALDIAAELIKYGKVASRPLLGITVESIQYRYAMIYKDEAGVTVTQVTSGSCAEKAGIKVGDRITHFNGVEVLCNSQLNYQKELYKAGDTVTVTVERDGKSIELTVVLEAANK